MGLASVVIAYGCCVGSFEKLQRHVLPWIGDKPLYMAYNQTSISMAYNELLNCGWGYDAFVLLHDDLEIIDPNFEEKILKALADPDVALVGVAGGYGVGSLAWWNANTIGHQLIDSGTLDFGQRTGDVDLIEGSIMVLSPWAIANLEFDEGYGGFHAYPEISLSARELGKRTIVIDIDTHHHTTLGFKSVESAESWAESDRRFQEKWFNR